MKAPSRRHLLRGAGVALALPWLESLVPRRARGQSAAAVQRFVAMYFPLGSADYWAPRNTGAGPAWQLSPILEPLTPVKNRVTVLAQVDQTAFAQAAFAPSSIVGMENELLATSFLTGAAFTTNGRLLHGTSFDQSIAPFLSVRALGGPSRLMSLQVGLATMDAATGDAASSYLRNISWSGDAPLERVVDPQVVFDAIVAGGYAPDPTAAARWAARKSVLDYVIGNAASLQGRLGRSDRERMDSFLTSVRDLEERISVNARCLPVSRPTLAVGMGAAPNGYDRDAHANVMIDLLVMALSCDLTRVATFMLDDPDSTFVYDFLDKRSFSAAGSLPTTDKVSISLRDAATASGTDDGWATINRWFVSKLATLCQKMAAIQDGETATLLDNSVVWFGSGQHQGADTATNLPVLYVGGGCGRLQVDQSIGFAPSQRLSNVYQTFLRAFDVSGLLFGDSTGTISALET